MLHLRIDSYGIDYTDRIYTTRKNGYIGFTSTSAIVHRWLCHGIHVFRLNSVETGLIY